MPAGRAWSGGEELRSELAAERTNVLGAVHEQRSNEPPVLREVASRERGLISVEDDSLPSLRGAYVLKPETELVRTRSRESVWPPVLCAEDGAGDRGRLPGRARPVFETDMARMLGAPRGGDVTAGVDVRESACGRLRPSRSGRRPRAGAHRRARRPPRRGRGRISSSIPFERRRPRSVPSLRRRTLSTPAPSLRATPCSR